MLKRLVEKNISSTKNEMFTNHILGKRDIMAPMNVNSLKNIIHELGIIQLAWPTIIEPEFEGRNCFPESYYKNSNKEKLLLSITENFRRQLINKFVDRKPLLLQALNECGIQKMVCTTIRPTQVPVPEFLNWQGCASFVADYCSYEVLKDPILQPERIISPSSVLKRRKGNCFELSTLLVSLLETANCLAFVVVGRAAEDRTLGSQARTSCPLQINDTDDIETDVEENVNKYTVQPKKVFQSNYLLQKKKELEEKLLAEEKRKKEEIEYLIAESEKPPPDPLHGWRLHSWVLVLSKKNNNKPEKGKNEDEIDTFTPFYIEPFTGNMHSLEDSNYLSIESIYNHENYYVHLNQNALPTHFDFKDTTKWESLLCIDDTFSDQQNETITEKGFDMPFSWVEKLDLTINDVTLRYPGGKKTTHFKKCILEKFAQYSRKDGLVMKLTDYDDYEYKTVKKWYEWYEYRCDNLLQVFYDSATSWITENFEEGRKDCLKVNKFIKQSDTSTKERYFEFLENSRPDCLIKIEMSALSIKEHYGQRDDRLYEREIQYYKSDDQNKKNLLSVRNKYKRNPNVSADEDIAEKLFLKKENKVILYYHYPENSILRKQYVFRISITCEDESTDAELNCHLSLDKDMESPRLNQLQLYKMLNFLREEIFKEEVHVKEIEDEIESILKSRNEETNKPKLRVSLFNTERNQSARDSLTIQEIREQNQKDREMGEIGIWPGAPYMAREGTTMPTKSAKYSCLEDFKNMQTCRQNIFQTRYNTLVDSWKEEQTWYLNNHYTISNEMKDEYAKKCHKSLYEISALEFQLQRQQHIVKKRYKKLQEILRLSFDEEQ